MTEQYTCELEGRNWAPWSPSTSTEPDMML